MKSIVAMEWIDLIYGSGFSKAFSQLTQQNTPRDS
jgi:hypothetical protein